MNRKNGQKTVAGASTAHYSKSAYEPRTSSGFHSFLKWFKKDEQGRSIRNISNSKSNREENSNYFKSIDEIKNIPSSQATRNGLSAASSCDSIISTATTGFAFIPPNQYRPNGNASQPEILIEAGPTTDTYRQRLRAHQNAIENDKKLELTLRKKYNIFDSDTVTSIDSIYKRLNGSKSSYYTDLSLPQASTSGATNNSSTLSAEDTIGRVPKPNRRTASDSSKDKKAGAYLHVKGKRKAPDPPFSKGDNRDSDTNRLSTSTNSGTLSPHSTLGRKKRRAPPPPSTQQSIHEDVPTVLSNGLLDDEEIKAIIQGTSSTFSIKLPEQAMDKSKESDNVVPSSDISTTSSSSSVRCTDTLRLEKGILRSTRETTTGDNNPRPEERHSSISPSSISPRPWYKRSPASNKDYAIPFKKEIVLRTMEKRKIKKTAKELESPQLPEFGFARNSSLFEGFFSRAHQDRSDDQEKRRSGIGMPNISELDREAAEIVYKEQENQRVKRLQEHEKYFNKVSESKDNLTSDNEIKFTTNNAFIEKKDRACVDLNGNESRGSKSNFINRMEKPSSRTTETESIFSNSVNKLSTKTVNDSNEKVPEVKQSENSTLSVVKKNESTVSVKNVWICAYCTLENVNWRVICEVCERIRSPDKQTAGMPVIDSSKVLKSSNVFHKSKEKLTDQKQDWDNKTDKVMKYFRPRICSNSLSKSSSESSVCKSTSKKSNKLPLSPKLLSQQKKICTRNSDLHNDIVRPPTITKSSERLTSSLIDSSAVVTTVTTVFHAPPAKDDSDASKRLANRNLEEVRLARLAKFSQDTTPQLVEKSEKCNNKSDDIAVPPIDSTSLEREKLRLREMIRAMNARALAEKYPVLQKSASLDDDTSKIKAQETQAVKEEQGLKPGTGVIRKVFNRKPIVEDKEIADNSNFASNSKLDKEKLFLKLSPEPSASSSKPQRPDVLLIPTPIQELNEDEKSPTPTKISKLSRKEEPPITIDSSKCTDAEKPDLVKISQELNSSKGLENFKATLRGSSKQFSSTNTLALNKILKNLEVAIVEGKHELAAKLAMDLAKMKVSLTVTKQQQNKQILSELDDPPKVENVVVDMFVEDAATRKGPIQISIFPTLSVLDLKMKILKDFRIPVERQKWILNDKLATDDKQCLTEFGMDDKSVIYLYIQDLKKTNALPDEKLSNVVSTSVQVKLEQDLQLEQEIDNDEVGAKALPLPADEIPSVGTLKVGWVCPLCTLINSPNRPGCVACSESRPSNYVIPDEYKRKQEYEMPEELRRFLNDDSEEEKKLEVKTGLQPETSNDLNRTKLVNRKSAEILNISITERDTTQPLNKSVFPYKSTNAIPQTTSIVMTAITSSPNITKNRYRGVDNYNPHVMKKVEIVSTANLGVIPKPVTISKLQEPLSGRTSLLPISQPFVKKQNSLENGAAKNTSKHYNELLSLDTADVVPNAEPFECPVCFMKFGAKDGVVLRDCLHVFCRECIINTIKYNEEAEVKCPYLDAEYSCDSIIQEREIKSLVSKDIYEQHLAISLRVAENRTENAYHCKTPNCKGWCIFEDNVNEFKCPICKMLNCLTCTVIHDGLNCKQYQDQMNSNCDSNAEARRTKDMLAEMIEKGDAMNCPVILMKKWGCDWLRCSMCKTEICWVTRGIRWGPEGKGDTSAGCKCGVNGVKCHPKCNYCH
ncbi:RanBP-type and C3HC4-type zinc finger-containing protein 1 [Pseudolycoriella hygida]|uniref:RanBP-type and C3HC4-type zinc finger-containing protein 1 n=1 Tax=Pseudolycoriella hygida TaxID=35572 RepID=A0A9Q0S9D5_9DIPT|nr:RanBP-type and C3HC4-type zinc finger-containing protein 1 [Pseudolycoriella hygida]